MVECVIDGCPEPRRDGLTRLCMWHLYGLNKSEWEKDRGEGR